MGHSERRSYYNETDEEIQKKIQAALKEGFSGDLLLPTLTDKNWKYEEIIEIGNMFSIDIMSEKYVNWYKEVMA